MLGARILLRVSRDRDAPDFPGGTQRTSGEEAALSFVVKTVPGFMEIIQSNVVLDFGCGGGWQSVAMAKRGAARVTGLDIRDLQPAAEQARRSGCADRTSFTNHLPFEAMGTFDVVVSCSSFEHFSDAAGALDLMRWAARPGGIVVITFAEPWYSPHGSHMNFFAKIPWVNLLFSERSVMEVRSRFRFDGARRYEDVEGGLNRMTLRKFERIIRSSGMRTEFLKYYPVKGLPGVDKLPIVRELLVGAVACILRKPEE
ncbi:MAG: class I SAM-dependent methyltransferase [Terriglobia bacterium]